MTHSPDRKPLAFRVDLRFSLRKLRLPDQFQFGPAEQERVHLKAAQSSR